MDSISTAARTDYAGNAGTVENWPDAGEGSNNPDPSFADRAGFIMPWSAPLSTSRPDGAIRAVDGVKVNEISDGLSYTYLLGEKYINPDHYADGTDPGDNSPLYCGTDWDFERFCFLNSNGVPTVPLQDQAGWPDYRNFGSAHPGGLNMALCDGSVVSISYSIDPLTHQHLCKRDDGFAIDGNKW
jgi:prepilin-type processing-associated H-X9-DG protein